MTTKADAFSAFLAEFSKKNPAKRNAWESNFTTVGDRVELTAINSEKGETIFLVWTGDTEVYGYEDSVFSRGDSSWSIRNVSEARKIVLGQIRKGNTNAPRTRRSKEDESASASAPTPGPVPTPDAPTPAKAKGKTPVTDAPAPVPAKPKKARSPRNKIDADDKPVKSLPFSVDDTDEIILAALRERKITWRKGAVKMTDRIGANNLKIAASKSTETPGRKMITFAGDNGFTTVYLDLILTVA